MDILENELMHDGTVICVLYGPQSGYQQSTKVPRIRIRLAPRGWAADEVPRSAYNQKHGTPRADGPGSYSSAGREPLRGTGFMPKPNKPRTVNLMINEAKPSTAIVSASSLQLCNLTWWLVVAVPAFLRLVSNQDWKRTLTYRATCSAYY